jgi:HAD superfamily hydrolase (TIGR01509 family)
VLVDTEQLWDDVRAALTEEWGGQYTPADQTAMMGMSSPEWSRYLRKDLGVPLSQEEINRDIVGRMQDRFRDALPLLPGAGEAVRALAARWPLGLASSSNRELIDLFLELSGFGDAFRVTVSSEEVARGKPAPDVYLEAASQLGVDAARCVAIEDSSNGIRAGAAAGMTVIAAPNPHYPPAEDALALAAVTVEGVAEITPDLVEKAAG